MLFRSVALFYDLVKDARCVTAGKVAPEKMAVVWSSYAKGRSNKIFYKLPQHLIKFVKVYEHQQEEKRTLLANEPGLATLNAKLKAPSRVSRVSAPPPLNVSKALTAPRESRRTRAAPAENLS